MIKNIIILFVGVCMLAACGVSAPVENNKQSADEINTNSSQPITNAEIQVIVSGGYELDPRDNGRPVILIASALGVSEDVFREAFSHVNPAGAGSSPSEEQAQANKAALMNVLAPYGITNDKLDEVSNYYRYNRSAGETWSQSPAVIEAVIENGVVAGFKIIDAGSGYTSSPTITVTGSDVSATGILSFTQDFETNGSITEIVINK